MSAENFDLILKKKKAAMSSCSTNSLTCSESLNIEGSFINFAQNVYYGQERLPPSNDDLILKTK